jgi:microcystin-dependent protein
MNQKTTQHIMNTMKRFGILTLGILLVSSAFGEARPPRLMTYQGYVRDDQGDPLGNSNPVNKTMQFYVYDAETGGNVKWAEEQIVTVDNGYFSVILGEGNAIGDTPNSLVFEGMDRNSDMADSRYVGVKVDGVDINPRLRLMTAPYAYLAQEAIQAKNADNATNATTSGRAVNADREVPMGGVIIWTKEGIPDGWAICNGTLNTPDLRGRFVLGVGPRKGTANGTDWSTNNNLKNTGGNNKYKLVKSQMPQHQHTVSVSGGGSHNHSVSVSGGSHNHSSSKYAFSDWWYVATSSKAGNPIAPKRSEGYSAGSMGTTSKSTGHKSHNHTASIGTENNHSHAASSGNQGSNGLFDSRPAFCALYYIMRIQ